MEIMHFASKAAKIAKSAIASLSQRIFHHWKTRKYYLQQIWFSYKYLQYCQYYPNIADLTTSNVLAEE